MPTDRTAFRFLFKLGNKVLCAGITSNPWFSEEDLRKKPGWDKGRLKDVGDRTTWDVARAWLEEQRAKGRAIAS